MLKPSFYTYKTPLGLLTIGNNGSAITQVNFGRHVLVGDERPSALSNEASTQILQYLARKRFAFDVPIHYEGTEFQREVWQEILGIAYGETKTYGEIAAALGNRRATRAVGMACNKNPLLLLIPCHRVIGARGNLAGYAAGTKIKEHLLHLESNLAKPAAF